MIFVYIAIAIFVVLFFVYLYLIAPKKNTKAIEKFRNIEIAHRGLHRDDIPENSMEAFSLAVEEGYAIELDVRLTKDEKLVVIHDHTTKRVCGEDLLVEDSTYEELYRLNLKNTGEKIPLFFDVLRLVDGKVPLLVELKGDGTKKNSSPYVAALLDQYQGDYLIESFDPRILAWFKKNRPNVIRGQLSTKIHTVGGDNFKDKFFGFLITNLLTNVLTRPNFIAYDYQYLSNASLRLCNFFFHPPIFLWTLKGKEQVEKYKNKYFGYIFEK